MDVKQEAGAAGFLAPEIKMEEEDSAYSIEREEDVVLLKTSGRSRGDAGHKVKQESKGETSKNWDAQLQEFLKTLQNPPSVEKTSQQPETKQSTDPKMSQIVSQGTADSNLCCKEVWILPQQSHLTGDVEQDSNTHLNASLLGKEKEKTLTRNPAKAELQRQHFRMLSYEEARSPQDLCLKLQECCRQWLEPERHTKEQMLELVTLEQLLAILPLDMQSWVKERGPETCVQAVTLAEEFLRRQPEGKIRELQVVVFLEEQSVKSIKTVETLPDKEMLQLLTVDKHRHKGNGNVLSGDGWLNENQKRKPLLDNTEWVEQPTTSMKTDEESDFLCLGEADENQCKAEVAKEGIKANGVNQLIQPQGEGIRLPATQEDEMECNESEEESQLLVHKEPEGLEEEPYRCWHCGESFGSCAKLVTHERTHVGEKLYKCSCCGESERTHTGQKPHKCSHCGNTFGCTPQERIPGGERLYTCSECGTSCSQRSDFLKHQRTHTGEKPYSCSVCGKKFRNGSGLKVHQRTHTGEKPYKCLHCGKCFGWSSHLISHGRIHSAVCSYCGRSFSQKLELLKHEKTHAADKSFSCFACGQTFGVSSELVVHVRTHKEKPFECSACGKTFRNSLQRKAHQKVHSGEKPHQCSHCGNSFGQRQMLLAHERIHTGEKPQACLVCGKNFWNIPNLRSHERTHMREKPYQCSHCEKCFRWRSHLVMHERVHMEEKPYRCSDCGRTFDRQSNLQAHIRIHTGQRPYICSVCGKSFTSSSVLLRHQKIHEEEICTCLQCGKTFQQQPDQAYRALKCSECLRGRHPNSDLACAQTPAEEKQFKCSACGKTFRNSSHLITHQSVHTGVQPHRCVDCGRNIVRRPNLIPAANEPAGPKPHKCSGCQNRLSQISVS